MGYYSLLLCYGTVLLHNIYIYICLDLQKRTSRSHLTLVHYFTIFFSYDLFSTKQLYQAAVERKKACL